uniref:Ig-like domain-containing protein n=1 Tax=Oreochromis aureus TaxID=47969 RepID=A0AAZ1XBR7_OREAU
LLNLTCWISVLAFELHTVKVQPGEEVTLQCSNLSSYPVHLSWFRSTNRSNASKISSMFSPESNATFYEGFQNSKFNMTSNTSVLFLEIKQVDSSDSGLYFCGEDSSEKLIVYSATNLKQIKHVLFLIPVKKLRILLFIIPKIKDPNEFQMKHYSLCVVCIPNRAEFCLTLHIRTKIRRPVPQRELEPNVVYAATR